eukprot:552017_1
MIWIIGGYYDEQVGGYYLNTVHVIHTINNQVSLSSDRLSYGVAGTSAIIVADVLYAFGGSNGDALINGWMQHTLSETASLTNIPTRKPSVYSVSSASPSTYSDVKTDWIIKVNGENCGDGYHDLDIESSYYGMYCQRCGNSEAGTNGKCFKCSTLEEPDHSRTTCQFFHPWWLYLLEIVVGLSCIGALICAIFKKIFSKHADAKNRNSGPTYNVVNNIHTNRSKLEITEIN